MSDFALVTVLAFATLIIILFLAHMRGDQKRVEAISDAFIAMLNAVPDVIKAWSKNREGDNRASREPKSVNHDSERKQVEDKSQKHAH